MTMSRIATTAAIMATAITLGGCVPVPNYRYYAPAVSGVVLRDGAPVAEAEVRVSNAMGDEVSVASTGIDGRFQTAPIRTLQLVRELIGDALSSYALQIRVDGNAYVDHPRHSSTQPPRQLHVVCDLSDRVDDGRGGRYCMETDAPVGSPPQR